MMAASLGYVILYVEDVNTALSFYENAFGFPRRFFYDRDGQTYGELETGAARLAFASFPPVAARLGQEFIAASPGRPALGFEIALVTTDVPALYTRAVTAGAVSISEPVTKRWGQNGAYL